MGLKFTRVRGSASVSQHRPPRAEVTKRFTLDSEASVTEQSRLEIRTDNGVFGRGQQHDVGTCSPMTDLTPSTHLSQAQLQYTATD